MSTRGGHGRRRNKRLLPPLPQAKEDPVTPRRPLVEGESLAERVRRVTAERDRQAAVNSHQAILDLGRAWSKRMKGAGQ